MVQKINKSAPIIVTGFPYAFPYYFKVFDFLAQKEDYIFILPKRWIAKKGAVDVHILKQRQPLHVETLKAFSFGGKSVLRGLFKGWLPGLIFILPKLKFKYRSKMLYSCSEPHLLTTLFNGVLAKLLGLKHIGFTWQNIPPKERMRGIKLKLSNFLVNLNLALSDGMICGNKKAADVISKFKPNLPKIVCPLSGVDVDRFYPGDFLEKDNTILFYGALDNRKGLDVLIKAFSKIPKSLEAKLSIIGTGPKKDELLELAEELEVNNRVEFLPWLKNDDLPNLVRKASVFVYPSVPFGGWEEQFGYAMAEASASGIPVVSTKTGSIEEVVLDQETGILVEPNNIDALSKALTNILLNSELKITMGKKGREFIVKKFSNLAVANQINQFLNSFL